MQTQAIHCTWPGLLASVISDPEAHTQIELSEELTLLVPGLQAEVTEHPLTEMTKVTLVVKLLLSIFFFSSNINYIIEDNMHTKTQGSRN